jgi:hypothetical protein
MAQSVRTGLTIPMARAPWVCLIVLALRGSDAVAISQATPAPRGHLTLEVDPPDAIVELDGVALQGPSPFVATELSTGRHELRVHREGHVAWTRVVHVPASQLHLPIKLLPERARTNTSELGDAPEETAKTDTSREPTIRAQSKADSSGSLVDCILAPDLPRCQEKKSEAAPTGDAKLPDRLAQAEIKAGVDAVLPKARACGSKHGAPAGEMVRVKISITGATGKVSSSTPQSPHADTPLGRCVAAALGQAVFPKFSRAGMGAVYPVRM